MRKASRRLMRERTHRVLSQRKNESRRSHNLIIGAELAPVMLRTFLQILHQKLLVKSLALVAAHVQHHVTVFFESVDVVIDDQRVGFEYSWKPFSRPFIDKVDTGLHEV